MTNNDGKYRTLHQISPFNAGTAQPIGQRPVQQTLYFMAILQTLTKKGPIIDLTISVIAIQLDKKAFVLATWKANTMLPNQRSHISGFF